MENNNPPQEHDPARIQQDGPERAPADGSNGGRRILIPLDGSPLAEMALPHAVALARATSSGLVLLRVMPPRTWMVDPTAGAIAGSGERNEMHGEEPELASRYLQEVVERLAFTALPVETGVIEGVPDEVLVQYARDHPAVATIVLATRGDGGVGQWLFGSGVEKLLQRSSVPLVLVRPESEKAPHSLAAVPRYKTLLVPLDGSPFAEQALDQARLLAQALEAHLVLLAVSATPIAMNLKFVKRDAVGEWAALPWETPTAQAIKYLDGIIADLATAGVRAEAQVTYGDIGGQILKVAEFVEADIIVMSTHGRGGLERVMLGSIAKRVAQVAPIPLLLVRPKKQAGDR